MKYSSLFILFVFVAGLSGPLHAKSKSSDHLWDYKRKKINSAYSIQDEIKIGETYMQEQIKEFEKRGWGVNEDEATLKRIRTIMNRLAKVSDLPKLPYEVTLFEKDDVVNAYCLPGGKMGVFTGLFDQKNGLVNRASDDELAAVMGHEMAHATRRHVTRRMTTMNGISLIGNIVTLGVGQGLGDNWANVTQQIFYTGSYLYMPSYSRKFEAEADRVGLYYMAKAGYNPQAAIDVWQRAAERTKKASSGRTKTQFFDSHPASGERATYLKKYLNDAHVVRQNPALH